MSNEALVWSNEDRTELSRLVWCLMRDNTRLEPCKFGDRVMIYQNQRSRACLVYVDHVWIGTYRGGEERDSRGVGEKMTGELAVPKLLHVALQTLRRIAVLDMLTEV
ncbi:MAG: hypothetical protein AB7L09_01810 [Nitrospira sp.]